MGSQNQKISAIYKITNIANNKCYIGKSIDAYYRLKTHKKYLKNNKHSNPYLQNEFNKYSFKNFKFDIVEIVDNVDILNDKEKYWISYFSSNNKKFGYNMTDGGDGGDIFKNKSKVDKDEIINKQKLKRSKKYSMSKRQTDLILKLKQENLSIRKIEKIINSNNDDTENYISGKIISKFLKTKNISTMNPRKYVFSDDEKRIIISFYNKNETIVNISNTMNISGKSIVRLLKENNLYK